MAKIVRCGNTLINMDNVVNVFLSVSKIKIYSVHGTIQEMCYNSEADALSAFETISKECKKIF